MAATIGEILSRTRIERHLTLEQASQATHIRIHYLEALENNKFDSLPSEVQGRGFIRLYADFLGISAQLLLNSWNVITAPEPPELLETSQSPLNNISNEELSDTDDKLIPPISSGSDETPASDLNGQRFSEVSPSIFEDIGNTLLQQRESLGLTIADVERHTHVRQHYLEALEEGKIDQLPSPVQGRGMLNNYARFLELDSESLLLHFADGLQAQRLERASKQPSSGIFTKRRPAHRTTWRKLITTDLIIGSVAILLVLFFIIWSTSQITELRSQEIIETAPSIADVLIVSPTSVITPSGPVATQLSPISQVEDSTSNPADSGIMTSTIPSINNAPLQLYVIAHQRAWLQVISDQEEVFNGRVLPGNAYPFSGTEQIELLTGNAAALQISFNQSDIGILGDVGQAISLIFSYKGVQTPTPMFTPTSTPTLLATITINPTPTVSTPTVTPFVP